MTVRLGLCAVGLLALAACGSGDEPPTAAAGSSTTEPSATESPMHEHELDSTPLPSTAPAGAPTPVELATAAMRAFVDHTVTAEVWYEQLAGLLSAAGQEAYYATDPTQIPARTLIGDPWITGQSDYLVQVQQGTDAGMYRLLLSRAADGAWQIEWIRPVE